MRRHFSAAVRATRAAACLVLCVVVAALLVACGTHGTAPALGQPAHVGLNMANSGQSFGTATLTPFYATHLVAYMGGQRVPYSGAQTPVQLRQDRCNGPVLASLTDNAPGPDGGQAPLLVQPDAVGGVDVNIAPSATLWVSALDHPGDGASIVACGHPLSGQKQYFDLYQASVGDNGIGLGDALSDPIIASRVDVALAHSASGAVAWSVRDGGCAGGMVASGQFSGGATHGGIVFAAPDTQHWWLTVSPAGEPAACGKVSE
jgi:hypothetical protein